jgi:hypothetical protein
MWFLRIAPLQKNLTVFPLKDLELWRSYYCPLNAMRHAPTIAHILQEEKPCTNVSIDFSMGLLLMT